MRIVASLLLAVLASCVSEWEDPAASSSAAQEIVDRFAHEHPEIARLSLHAVPQGEKRMRIVASTVAGRIGEPSDPEDVRAGESGEAVTLQEGQNLDYTVPATDADGRTVVIGLTVSGTLSGDAKRERARELADAIAAEIRQQRRL